MWWREESLPPPSTLLSRKNLLLDPASRTAPTQLSVQQSRDAALSTPARKTTSFDGFHPRHLGVIDDEGVELLAMIRRAVELTAVLPRQFDDLSAKLLMKKNGSLRDFAVFHGVVRTCTRARQDICRQWERDHDLPCFESGPARSAVDVVWRTAMRAESAVVSGRNSAAILWDMRAFFQMIKHKRLLERAYATEFFFRASQIVSQALQDPQTPLFRADRRRHRSRAKQRRSPWLRFRYDFSESVLLSL